MSPTRKARAGAPPAAKKTLVGASAEGGPAQRELAFLIVGVIALMEGLALILLARRKP